MTKIISNKSSVYNHAPQIIAFDYFQRFFFEEFTPGVLSKLTSKVTIFSIYNRFFKSLKSFFLLLILLKPCGVVGAPHHARFLRQRKSGGIHPSPNSVMNITIIYFIIFLSHPMEEKSLYVFFSKDTANELTGFVFTHSFMLSAKQEAVNTNSLKSYPTRNRTSSLPLHRRRSILLTQNRKRKRQYQ